MTLLLGLDLGTTNIKALVADETGKVLAEASRGIGITHCSDAVVHQDMDEMLRVSREVIKDVASQVDSRKIAAMGVSAQGGAMQLLTPDGKPVGPVISWLDKSGESFDVEFTERTGRQWLADHIGRGRSGLAIGQILRLRKESPDSVARPNKIGFVGDVVTSFFTGNHCTDATSLGLTLLYNPYQKDYDAELLELLNIRRDQLPALADPGQPSGTLLPETARELGLPAGIPVSAPIHDQYAAALGAGAVRNGDIMFGAGTAWVLLAVSDRAIHSNRENAFLCTHVVSGLYGQILSLSNGGSSLKWCLELLGLRDVSQDKIDQMIMSAEAGCEGLRFWPLLSAFDALGIKPGTRGRLSGLQLFHRRDHLVRSIIEGLACELNRYLSFLLDSGVNMKRLLMCGKAGTGAITPQILADVIGQPVSCVTYSGASTLGAAVLAAGLVQPGRPLDEIADGMVAPSRIIRPGKDRKIYAGIMEEYISSLPKVT